MDEQILSILKEMQGQMKEMQGQMKEMQGQMKEMQGEIRDIKETQKEHTQILRALEHNSQVAKSEREAMKHDINTTLGKVSSIGNTLNCVEMATAHNWSEITRIKSSIS